MKRFARLGWVSVVVFGFNAFAWSTLEGCSGDDNGGDAGDANPDQTGPDVKNDVVPQEGGQDVVQDVISEDAGPDVTAVLEFRQAYALALCKRLDTCCNVAQLDASAGDAGIAQCMANAESPNLGGIEFAIGEIGRSATLNSGHVVVDQTAATSCLADLATLPCGTITGSTYDTMAQNCLGALKGNVPVGSGPCYGSVECDNGYCQEPDGGFAPDAGGKCVALSAQGQPCSPIGGGNDQCMYRGWLGTTQLRCDLTETEGNTCNTEAADASFKCTAPTANGDGCLFEWECASGTCGDSCQCIPSSSTWTYPFFGVCPAYFGPDSGLQ